MRSTVAALLLVVCAVAAPSPSSAAGEQPAVANIQLSFKLDPRLAGPTYGSTERWVSPPTYTGAHAQQTVDAMAQAIDARGRPTKAAVQWAASDPEMVTVAPAPGGKVTITVKRAGESSLTVKSGEASRKLAVRAVQPNGVWRVSISQ
jgi:hypothetical protein